VIGVGIIGCGLVGRKRAAALPSDARLRGVFDVSNTRAVEFVRGDDTVFCADNVEQLLRVPEIDLVIIATPHRELARLTLDSIGAGKHVLVEKPGAIDVASAQRVAAQARSTERIVRVGFNHRFHPSLLEAKRIVDGSQYGRVLHVRARYGHGGRVGYEKEWRADPSLSGGGELIDQGIHLIDLTRFLVGDVDLAWSELRNEYWPMSVEDNAFLGLHSSSGAFGWLHASWTEWKNLFSFEVTLERAKIDISGLGGSYGVETLTLYEMLPEMGPPEVQRHEWPDDDVSWQAELRDVLHGIRGRPALGADIGDAVAALSVVSAAYRADATPRPTRTQ